MLKVDSQKEQINLPGLNNAVVLITGATRGIGYATAELFAQCGARVAINSRSLQEAQRAARELSERFEVATLPLVGDVSNAMAVEKVFARLTDWSKGRLDVLVCAAGYPVEDALWETPLHQMESSEVDEWFQRVRIVDLDGARFCSRYALKMMVEQRRGSIAFISSTPALSGYHGTPYTEAKAALLGLMRDLAIEYGKFGIRVNAVAPGNISSGWYEKLDETRRKELATEAPLGRWGTAEEVAGTILFLASELAGFITGQTIVIDGGKVIH